MKRLQIKTCPCHGGKSYNKCCKPFHTKKRNPNPKELMLSRFSGYALGMVDYIIETTDPAGPKYNHDLDRWRAELEHFCKTTSFIGLEVMAASGEEVTFRADLIQEGRSSQLIERSRFKQVNGRWLYHDGDMI